MRTKQRFCSECGVSLEENDHFCPVCGAKVLDEDESNQKKSSIKKTTPLAKESSKVSKDDIQSEKITIPSSQQDKKKSKLWLTISAITMIVFVIYTLFVVFQTGGSLLPYVTAVSFSQDNSNQLVSAGSDNHLEIWDLAQGKNVKRKKFASSYGIHRALAWSPNNQIIALARVNPVPIDNEIILFDSQNLNQIFSLSTGSSVPIALCIDPDGNTLYSVTHHLGISVWDIKERRRLGGLEDLPDRLIRSASFDINCQKIATIEDKDTIGTADDKLVVYQRINMDTLFEIRIDEIKSNPSYVALDFSGKFVNTIEYYTNKLQSWDIATQRQTERMIDELRSIHSLAMGKNNRFAIGYSKGKIKLFDNDGRYEQTLRHGPVLGLILEPILNYFD